MTVSTFNMDYVARLEADRDRLLVAAKGAVKTVNPETLAALIDAVEKSDVPLCRKYGTPS